MNIAVCVKQIPDPAVPGELNPEIDVRSEHLPADTLNAGSEGEIQRCVGEIGGNDPMSGRHIDITEEKATCCARGPCRTTHGARG